MAKSETYSVKLKWQFDRGISLLSKDSLPVILMSCFSRSSIRNTLASFYHLGTKSDSNGSQNCHNRVYEYEKWEIVFHNLTETPLQLLSVLASELSWNHPDVTPYRRECVVVVFNSKEIAVINRCQLYSNDTAIHRNDLQIWPIDRVRQLIRESFEHGATPPRDGGVDWKSILNLLSEVLICRAGLSQNGYRDQLVNINYSMPTYR